MNVAAASKPHRGSAVLKHYRRSGVRARLHTAIRWITAPIDEIVRLVPSEGRVLDLGCGPGLLALRLVAVSTASVHAVDIDGSKIEVLQRVCDRDGLNDRILPRVVDAHWQAPPDTYDAIVVSDVLYRLGERGASDMICMATAALRPGGVLVIQDTDPGAGWRSEVSRLQEHLAVRVMGLTAGEAIEFVAPHTVVSWMNALGLSAEGPWPTNRLHPQFIVVGRRA